MLEVRRREGAIGTPGGAKRYAHIHVDVPGLGHGQRPLHLGNLAQQGRLVRIQVEGLAQRPLGLLHALSLFQLLEEQPCGTDTRQGTPGRFLSRIGLQGVVQAALGRALAQALFQQGIRTSRGQGPSCAAFPNADKMPQLIHAVNDAKIPLLRRNADLAKEEAHHVSQIVVQFRQRRLQADARYHPHPSTSWPMVVASPWPGYTMVSGGRANSRSREPRILSGWASGRSKRP